MTEPARASRPLPTTVAELASFLDATLLKPEATPADIAALCSDAATREVAAVCVSPVWVGTAAHALAGSPVRVATVVGFPSGAHATEIKAAEAARAAADGADEADMVVELGLVRAHDFDRVRSDVAAVRAAFPGLLKVIIESAALTDDEIAATCHAAVDAGADYVKTSTGFHPAGGASAHAVRLMRATVGDHVGVKASGGIRTLDAAREMIAAGATRLGVSAAAAILDEID